MNAQINILFFGENNKHDKCLYASCKFINYIEFLADKYKDYAKISVTGNNPFSEHDNVGYKVVVIVYFETKENRNKLFDLINDIINSLQSEYIDIKIQMC